MNMILAVRARLSQLAKTLLGIKSPSLEFKKMGEILIDDIIDGIKSFEEDLIIEEEVK